MSGSFRWILSLGFPMPLSALSKEAWGHLRSGGWKMVVFKSWWMEKWVLECKCGDSCPLDALICGWVQVSDLWLAHLWISSFGIAVFSSPWSSPDSCWCWQFQGYSGLCSVSLELRAPQSCSLSTWYHQLPCTYPKSKQGLVVREQKVSYAKLKYSSHRIHLGKAQQKRERGMELVYLLK